MQQEIRKTVIKRIK